MRTLAHFTFSQVKSILSLSSTLLMSKNLFSSFFDQLTQSSFVITPNNRLARTLQTEYANYQATHRINTWSTQSFIALKPWLLSLWNGLLQSGYHPHCILLTAEQSQSLWQRIVHEQRDEALLSVANRVPHIEKTWELIHEWGIDLTQLQNAETPDQVIFYQWAMQYQQTCHEQRWIDEAQLITYFIDYFTHHSLSLPKLFYLVGFHQVDHPPAIKQLFQLLEKQGHTTHYHTFHFEKNQQHTLACHDVFDEMHEMARWAHQRYQQAPHRKILCVVPQLTELREELSDIFFHTFQVDQQLAGTLPFNIAGGTPLPQLPIIQCLFQLLNLIDDPINISTLSYLFNSPFWLADQDEKNRYPLLELFLLSREQSHFSLAQLIHVSHERDCHLLSSSLLKLKNLSPPHHASPSQWVHYFTQLLTTFFWPGSEALTSQEYQAVQQWEQLLERFVHLDVILPSINIHTAKNKLLELAQHTLFQAETLTASIHVVGLLEAAGLIADDLWIMNMNNHIWPTRVGKNPFISTQLQRQLNMPHSSAERELAYCQALTKQLLHAAENVICSYAEKEGDEILSPSAPIAMLTPIPDHIKNSPPPSALTSLEEINDTSGPAFLNTTQVKGGSDILKQQALCPFRAFALYRLHAKLPDLLQPGLQAKNKGTLLHACLEKIWKALGSQQTLLQLSSDELSALTKTSIEQSCDELKNAYSASLLAIEKKRLFTVLMNWLDFEKNRAPFHVIQCEEKRSVTLGHLKLNLKIDRIDRLNQNQYVLIDYKTSAPNASPETIWLDERPDEPQLPLYAITYSEKISGIAFANFSAKKYHFKGMTAEKNTLPGCYTPMDWDDVLQSWHTHLTQLAHEFSVGLALTKPKKGEQTCRHCQLQTLCRLKMA